MIRNVLKGITWQRSTTSQRIGPGPDAVAPRLTHIAMTISGRRPGGMQPGRVYPPPSTETEVRSNLTRKTLQRTYLPYKKKLDTGGCLAYVCCAMIEAHEFTSSSVLCFFLDCERCFLNSLPRQLPLQCMLQCRCTRSDSRTTWTDLLSLGGRIPFVLRT
jgi:hypothetical protein